MPQRRARRLLSPAIWCILACYALLMTGAPLVDEHAPLRSHASTHCAICATSHSPQEAAEPERLSQTALADAGAPLPLRPPSFGALLPTRTTGRSPPIPPARSRTLGLS
jgi:hypothetical protein